MDETYTDSAGAIPLVNDEFRGQQLRFPGVTNVSCTGSEQHFSDCSYTHNIGDCDSAAIICQGEGGMTLCFYMM